MGCDGNEGYRIVYRGQGFKLYWQVGCSSENGIFTSQGALLSPFPTIFVANRAGYDTPSEVDENLLYQQQQRNDLLIQYVMMSLLQTKIEQLFWRPFVATKL